MPLTKTSEKAAAMKKTKRATTKVTNWMIKEYIAFQARGLLTLASWIAERHDKYGAFIKRVQQLIGGVLIAEKKESKR